MIQEHKQEIYKNKNRLSDLLFDERSLFLDIETTGLSPASSQIYLIGCACRKEDTLYVDQFFAPSKEDEPKILLAFLDQIREYSTLISFHGTGFDLPFLKARCQEYQIEAPFHKWEHLDIFKAISPIKPLLQLPNHKQKTLETFLDIQRKDAFSGKELIRIYQDYQKKQETDLLNTLLLHNFEDILGMINLLPLLSYLEIFRGSYSIAEAFPSLEGTKEKKLIITLKNEYPVPKQLSCHRDGFYFSIQQDQTRLCIPVYMGELHYFYPDYRNYYYLPNEDIAIHKSVAAFVDKKYRENAHAYNCYNRKTGEFLPQIDEIIRPVFRDKITDKLCYFELTGDFIASETMLQRYVQHILQLIIK